jgi:hypothetical protein
MAWHGLEVLWCSLLAVHLSLAVAGHCSHRNLLLAGTTLLHTATSLFVVLAVQVVCGFLHAASSSGPLLTAASGMWARLVAPCILVRVGSLGEWNQSVLAAMQLWWLWYEPLVAEGGGR